MFVGWSFFDCFFFVPFFLSFFDTFFLQHPFLKKRCDVKAIIPLVERAKEYREEDVDWLEE